MTEGDILVSLSSGLWTHITSSMWSVNVLPRTTFHSSSPLVGSWTVLGLGPLSACSRELSIYATVNETAHPVPTT
jgi:hypothetical protein